MKILILEDCPHRIQKFKAKFGIGNELTMVETASDCIKELGKGGWERVFLDHDLGGNQMVASGDGTGYEVAKWIERNLSPENTSAEFYVHSLNPEGAVRMVQAIRAAKLQCFRTPFIWEER